MVSQAWHIEARLCLFILRVGLYCPVMETAGNSDQPSCDCLLDIQVPNPLLNVENAK